MDSGYTPARKEPFKMYDNKYDKEYRDETSFGKKLLLWVIGLGLVLSFAGWVITRITKPAEQIIDNAIPNYEDFQFTYNQCQQINTDLGNVKALPETDKMFAQFSKGQIVLSKKEKLSNLVNGYNAKSKMWNRALWKSDKLPYQLDINTFSNYGGTQ
jgi:hypothetical protein